LAFFFWNNKNEDEFDYESTTLKKEKDWRIKSHKWVIFEISNQIKHLNDLPSEIRNELEEMKKEKNTKSLTSERNSSSNKIS